MVTGSLTMTVVSRVMANEAWQMYQLQRALLLLRGEVSDLLVRGVQLLHQNLLRLLLLAGLHLRP